MLRRLAALLALLLGLALMASAQEQSGTRETPPAGRAVPPVPVQTDAPAGRPSPRPAEPVPSGRHALHSWSPAQPAVSLRATRLANQPAQPTGGTSLTQTARRRSLAGPGAKLAAAPSQAGFMLKQPFDTHLVEILGLEPIPAAAPHHALFAGSGVSFGDSQAGSAPIELALPSGAPRMPPITLRPGLTQVTRGNAKQKLVALTFDDGPHPEYTSQLLSILDYYHIHATFFVVGVQAQKYPQWVKMIHQAGHEIGNHTYDHFRLPALPLDEVAYQIDENQRLMEQLTGVTPRFFRPPGGRYSESGGRLLQQRGMLLALWDVALNDTAEDREAGDLYTTASHKIRNGSVVLGHDGIQATIDMLPQLIESLRKDGYSFVTMSELASGM